MKEQRQKQELQLGVEGINPGGENPSGKNPTNDIDALLAPNPDDSFQIYDESYFTKFPPGYRFKPYDAELVIHYLQKRILNEPLPPNRIRMVDLYKHNPKALAGMFESLGEKEWYFFTPRDRKYRNGKRPNRAAADGYWKATGADKPIKHNDKIVGYRKALVFYEGKAPKGDKSNWIMHEYRVNSPPKIRRGGNDMRLDDWVLCRIQLKNRSTKATTNKTDSVLQAQQSGCETPAQPHERGQVSVQDSKKLATETLKPEAQGLLDKSDYCRQRRFFNTYDDVLLSCRSPYVNFSPCQSSWNRRPGFSHSYHHAWAPVQHNPESVAESLPSSRVAFPPTESHMKPEQFGCLTDDILNYYSDTDYFDPSSQNFTNF